MPQTNGGTHPSPQPPPSRGGGGGFSGSPAPPASPFSCSPSPRTRSPSNPANDWPIRRLKRARWRSARHSAAWSARTSSIEDSNAGLAHDIRVLLRQLLLKGDTDAQARQAIVGRYGEFVLLKPPVQPATYVLWFAPAAMLLLGFLGIVLWLRRVPATTAGAAPLSPQEQSRLDTLLREADR